MSPHIKRKSILQEKCHYEVFGEIFTVFKELFQFIRKFSFHINGIKNLKVSIGEWNVHEEYIENIHLLIENN